eukprot:2943869-Rhodomonas_salina.4
MAYGSTTRESADTQSLALRTRWPPMLLRTCYEMSGTDLGLAATRNEPYYLCALRYEPLPGTNQYSDSGSNRHLGTGTSPPHYDPAPAIVLRATRHSAPDETPPLICAPLIIVRACCPRASGTVSGYVWYRSPRASGTALVGRGTNLAGTDGGHGTDLADTPGTRGGRGRRQSQSARELRYYSTRSVLRIASYAWHPTRVTCNVYDPTRILLRTRSSARFVLYGLAVARTGLAYLIRTTLCAVPRWAITVRSWFQPGTIPRAGTLCSAVLSWSGIDRIGSHPTPLARIGEEPRYLNSRRRSSTLGANSAVSATPAPVSATPAP